MDDGRKRIKWLAFSYKTLDEALIQLQRKQKGDGGNPVANVLEENSFLSIMF